MVRGLFQAMRMADCGLTEPETRSTAGSAPRDGQESCHRAHTVRNASVGDRRAARIDGYRPATAPMTRAAPTPP